MTFKQILDAVTKLYDEQGYGSNAYKAWHLVCAAEENANDTFAEKGCSEADLERVAISSLEMLVGSERDAKVRKIFDRLGFKY